jgi:hypothetical protein
MTSPARIAPFTVVVLTACVSAAVERPARPLAPEVEPLLEDEREAPVEARLVPIVVPGRIDLEHRWLAPGDAFCFPAVQGCPLQLYRGEEVVARDETLAHLHIGGVHEPPEALAEVAGLEGPPLASVELDFADLTPELVEALLARAGGHLGVAVMGPSAELTDGGIEQLRRLGERLVALTLAFSDVLGEARRTAPIDLGFLEDLDRVQLLDLSSYDSIARPPFESLAPLSRMESLRVLRLGYWPTAEDQAALGRLSRLEELRFDFSSCCLQDVDYSFLDGLASLGVLRLDGLELPEDQAHHLDALGELRELEVVQQDLGPVAAEHVAGLDSLRRVLLWDLRLGDAGLVEIARLPRLEWLTLVRTGVTDLGMQALAGCPALGRLVLHEGAVSAAGIGALSEVGPLRAVEMRGADDEALAQLARLTDLRELSLEGRGISDAGVAALAALHRLERLALEHTSVTDQGLAHLGRLGRLRALGLRGSEVGDAGLAHLEALSALELLDLGSTQVSSGAARAFAERHPGCTVLGS